MKKLLIITLLLVACHGAYAQSAKVAIVNNFDWDITVIMYAYAPSKCTSACDKTFITNVIAVNSWSTWGANAPCAISGSPGWSVMPCNPVSWCIPLPSDFEWTLAKIDMSGGGCWPSAGGSGWPVYLSSGNVGCTGASMHEGTFTSSGCSSLPDLDLYWTGSGALGDVTILVDQH